MRRKWEIKVMVLRSEINQYSNHGMESIAEQLEEMYRDKGIKVKKIAYSMMSYTNNGLTKERECLVVYKQRRIIN